MTERKIFVSYDFCHDGGVLRRFQNSLQMMDEVLVTAHSMDYCHSHSDIIPSLQSAIARVDGLVVLVGKNTHRAGNVLQEAKIAQELDLPVVQLGGFSSTWCAGLSDQIAYLDWRDFSFERMFSAACRHAGCQPHAMVAPGPFGKVW